MRLNDTQFAPTSTQLPLFKVFSIPELLLKYEASIIMNASAPHHSSVPFGIINIQHLSLLEELSYEELYFVISLPHPEMIYT